MNGAGGKEDGQTSALWTIFFRAGYLFLRIVDPLARRALRRLPTVVPRIVEFRVMGRRTGRERGTLLTLLTVDGRWYIGHPNGETAWTRNLATAGVGEVVLPDGTSRVVSAIRLRVGPERERVIRATWDQQPFPANVVYRLARRHVRRVGVYHRLSELPAGDTGPGGSRLARSDPEEYA